jgi:dTDP-glucose 4,6-dehydratase
MKKALVVTGGAGFIGINFLEYLIKSCCINQYEKIFNIDKFGYATEYNKVHYENLNNILNKKDRPFITLKMSAEQFGNNFESIFDKSYSDGYFDILDFASESHVDNSIKNPAALYKENSKIPSDILAAFGNLKSINRYYHISTDEVYGDLPLELNGITSTYFTTSTQFKPSNPYSASKVAQDAYLHAMCRTFKLPVTIIRMANQFGEWQHPEKMIPASIIRAMNNESLSVYGNGKNCRQWTSVEKTVDVIGRILMRDSYIVNKEQSFEIFHLADMDNLMDNNALAWEIKRSLKRHNRDPLIEYIEDRLGHDLMYALSVDEPIKQLYNHNFQYSLDKTVDAYVQRFNNGDFT